MIKQVKCLPNRIAKRLRRFFSRKSGRRVLLLDSFPGQLDWIGIEFREIIDVGIHKGIDFNHYRVKAPAPTPSSDCPDHSYQDKYRGIRLFSVVEYSLYVSLEISTHEFDIANPRHRREMNRWFVYAKNAIDEVYSHIKKIKPSIIVVMQGYFVEGGIVRQLRDSYKFQVVALENTFCSNRIIVEPITGISVNMNSVFSWYHRFREETEESNCCERMRQMMSKIDKSKHPDHASPQKQFEWKPHSKRILFIGQCFTDSSLLFGVKGPYSTLEVINSLIDFARSCDAFVVCKLHPKENGGTNPLMQPYANLTLRRLNEVALGLPADEWVPSLDYFIDSYNEYATQALIADADVVVTINSQGGLEALALGKEVVLLGTAFYDQIGATWNVCHLSSLHSVLSCVLNGSDKLNQETRVANFIDIYFNKYCVERTASEFCTSLIERSLVI